MQPQSGSAPRPSTGQPGCSIGRHVDGNGTVRQARRPPAEEAGAAIKGATSQDRWRVRDAVQQRKTAAPMLGDNVEGGPSRTNAEQPGHIDSGHARAPGGQVWPRRKA